MFWTFSTRNLSKRCASWAAKDWPTLRKAWSRTKASAVPTCSAHARRRVHVFGRNVRLASTNVNGSEVGDRPYSKLHYYWSTSYRSNLVHSITKYGVRSILFLVSSSSQNVRPIPEQMLRDYRKPFASSWSNRKKQPFAPAII